ncbi:MAG: FHA domain-containing protein [Nitrococcus sp.]|nr:FHA domain-containing protein [Nitrococcus sp.]
MQLFLSVIGPEAKTLGGNASMSWTDSGGTIGRAANNDWTLPDPRQEISRCHARVRFGAGGFYLEDISANGVFLYDRATRLSATEAHRLCDGERLFIGGYQILVRIDEGAVAPTAAPPPAFWQPADARSLDPLELLGGPVPSEPESPPTPSGTGAPGYLEEHFEPRRPAEPALELEAGEPEAPPARAGLIPTDWWKAPASGRRTATADVPSVPTGGEAGAADDTVRALLAAAGVEPSRVTPELVETLERLLRISVKDLMDLLRARR